MREEAVLLESYKVEIFLIRSVLTFLIYQANILERLGIFHGEIREHVIDRIMALDTQTVDLSQIRWVVLMILFNTPGNESNYTWLQNLNSDKTLPYVH